METPSASSRPCALVISDAQMTRLCGDRRIRVPQPAVTTLFTCSLYGLYLSRCKSAGRSVMRIWFLTRPCDTREVRPEAQSLNHRRSKSVSHREFCVFRVFPPGPVRPGFLSAPAPRVPGSGIRPPAPPSAKPSASGRQQRLWRQPFAVRSLGPIQSYCVHLSRSSNIYRRSRSHSRSRSRSRLRTS